MLRENMLPGLVVRRSLTPVSPTTRYSEEDEKENRYSSEKSKIHEYTFSSGQKGDMKRNNNKVEDFCITKKEGTRDTNLKYGRCQCLEPWYLTK